MKNYDVIIVGGGPGGIYSAYELKKLAPEKRVAVFEEGHPLEKRRCPIDGVRIKSCIRCKTCSIMSGFGGAGAFSDGKYNITNDFGGTLYEHIGKKEALELMKYVDQVNMAFGGEGTKLYSTVGTRFKKLCIENKLNLLDASVRHLGTDINYVVLNNLFAYLKDTVDFFFDTPVSDVTVEESGYAVCTEKGDYTCDQLIVSVGRSGSKWMEEICKRLDIPTHSNRVDLGVRVELPAVVFSHLTDELYESKIVYRTEKFEDNVRTFCMNPNGIVVTENTASWSRRTPTASSPSTATATSGRTCTRRTPTLRSWCPSTSPSPSTTATSTARASPGYRTCWRGASWSSGSGTWSGAGGAR